MKRGKKTKETPLIYLASTDRCPGFFVDNATALADIRRCAAESE